MIGLLLLGPFGLVHMGLEDGLGEGATPALMVFALSMPAYLISICALFFLEGLHRPKAGMVAMWVANAVNLALNLLLVPDILGIGLDGAVASAWATFGARAALAIFLVIFILRLPEARAWGVFNKPKRDKAVESQQIKVGLGGGASNFIEVGAFAAMTPVRRPIGRGRDRQLGRGHQRLRHRLHGAHGPVVGDGGCWSAAATAAAIERASCGAAWRASAL
jgi:MATE family multidrug resistance protein